MQKIRRNHLVAKGACDEGLKWFDTLVREMGQDEDLEVEWDQLSMVLALSNPECREWARWAIDNATLPMWSLIGADLSRANLRGANLYGANLERSYYPTGPVPDGWRRTETGHLTKA